MAQELIVKYKNICGRDGYYPDNLEAKLMISMFSSGSGSRKVFTIEDLKKLETLGHNIKVLRPRQTEVIYEAE